MNDRISAYGLKNLIQLFKGMVVKKGQKGERRNGLWKKENLRKAGKELKNIQDVCF